MLIDFVIGHSSCKDGSKYSIPRFQDFVIPRIRISEDPWGRVAAIGFSCNIQGGITEQLEALPLCFITQ